MTLLAVKCMHFCDSWDVPFQYLWFALISFSCFLVYKIYISITAGFPFYKVSSLQTSHWITSNPYLWHIVVIVYIIYVYLFLHVHACGI